MYITVTMKEVDELVECGVDILAVQGTGALRPDGSTSAQFIRTIKAKYPDQLVMADCDNFENAMACAEAGADFVGTTMRGYTPETKGIDDIDLILSISWPQSARQRSLPRATSTTRSRRSRRWKLVHSHWWWAVPSPPGRDHGPLYRCHQRRKKVKWSVPDETVFWH